MAEQILPVRSVGADELKRFREKAYIESRGFRDRRRYGVSTGAGKEAPLVEANDEGNAELEVEKRKPRDAAALANRMEQVRQGMLARLQGKGFDAKLEMVKLLRKSQPGLFVAFPDTDEGNIKAVAQINELIRREAEAVAKRARIEGGYEKAIVIGRW